MILISLLAWASIKDKAKENLKSGNFQESYRLYKLAYQEEKGDAEVVSGFRKAAYGLLNELIVNLRDTKRKENIEQLLIDIEEIEKIQTEVKGILGYDSHRLFEKERKSVRRIILKKWDRDISQKSALKVFIQQAHYKFLDLNKDTLGRNVLKRIKMLGKQECLSRMKGLPLEYFVQRFTKNYCNIFGVSTSEKKVKHLQKQY